MLCVNDIEITRDVISIDNTRCRSCCCISGNRGYLVEHIIELQHYINIKENFPKNFDYRTYEWYYYQQYSRKELKILLSDAEYYVERRDKEGWEVR